MINHSYMNTEYAKRHIRQALILPTCQETVQQVAVTLGCLQHYFPKTNVDFHNISLLNSVQRLAETNIHQSLFLAFAHQFFVHYHELSKQFLSKYARLRFFTC